MKYLSVAIGRKIENLAANYLQQRGLRLVEKNFYAKVGEIDLIFYDPKEQQLVFVEVRYRKSILFGDPAESINKKKQYKLISTAQYYIITKLNHSNINSYRFDVVACSGPLNYIKINWIVNAFSCN